MDTRSLDNGLYIRGVWGFNTRGKRLKLNMRNWQMQMGKCVEG